MAHGKRQSCAGQGQAQCGDEAVCCAWSVWWLPVCVPALDRFWGWSENEREQQRAQEEAQSGTVIGQGESSLSDEMQGVAHRNSVFSQLNLAVLPWFNVVNHKYHS